MNQAPNTLQKRERMRRHLYSITATGILIALAMVTKLATGFSIPVLGPGGMRIGFSGIFTALPAFLFGPVYGGIASALSDLIGAFVKPEGAYIPWLTLTAFMGGFLKGLLWKIMLKAKGKKTSAMLLCVFLLIGCFGTANYVSLSADGVVNSVITTPSTVPTKDQISIMTLSPLSAHATKLATYQNDTLTVTAVPASNEIVIPSYATVNGFRYNVKKLAPGLFASCKEPLTVRIPETITTIDDSAFGNLTNVTVIAPKGSEAAKFAETKGYPLLIEEVSATEHAVTSGTDLQGEGFAFSSNGTYRKYLSGYLNFTTFGLILISLIGMLTSALLLAFSKKPAAILLMRTAIACIVSGVLVTTLNTEILRHFLAAYSGRSFLILWVPRLIEEIVVCLAQSYIIFLLLDIYQKRIMPRFHHGKASL